MVSHCHEESPGTYQVSWHAQFLTCLLLAHEHYFCRKDRRTITYCLFVVPPRKNNNRENHDSWVVATFFTQVPQDAITTEEKSYMIEFLLDKEKRKNINGWHNPVTSHGSTTGNLILHNEKGLPGTGESRKLGTIFLKKIIFYLSVNFSLSQSLMKHWVALPSEEKELKERG